jgi:F-type H+-transporting ATPase subunit b
MQQIIQQLGAMFVGAIPTTLLFIVLVLAYQFLVQGPLTATLKKRRALTEGAVEDAQKAIAQAEARTAEYAAQLRQARAEVYKVREQRVKQWNAERDAALEVARKAAGLKVSQARAELDAETAAAKQTILGYSRRTWPARSSAPCCRWPPGVPVEEQLFASSFLQLVFWGFCFRGAGSRGFECRRRLTGWPLRKLRPPPRPQPLPRLPPLKLPSLRKSRTRPSCSTAPWSSGRPAP